MGDRAVDLERQAHQLRLDNLAVGLCRSLDRRQIPHVLLKGPSTARWLYDPPREYADVDLLVPLTRAEDAVESFRLDALAGTAAGRLGEEAGHSRLLRSSQGYEIDLHVTLPMLSIKGQPRPEEVWRFLSKRIETMRLDGVGSIPVLDVPARCLVLALHALADGYQSSQVRDDLKRAQRAASPEQWTEARELAHALGVNRKFHAGLEVLETEALSVRPSTVEARLKQMNASGSAFGLERLAELRGLEKLRSAWQEAFPSRGFLLHDQHADPSIALLRLHLRRWRRIATELPRAFREWLSARRGV